MKPRASVGFGAPRRARSASPPPETNLDDEYEDPFDTDEDERARRADEEAKASGSRFPHDGELTDYHFMILGLRRESATPAMIREAYRRAVMSNHPDKNPHDPFALERFKAIQEVYEILSRWVGAR